MIIAIAGSAFGAAIPFIDPEAVDMTPVCQFIIVYLYVYAVVIVVVLDRILDTISKRALSIILLLYFLSWAASIAFGFLVLGGSYGIMMILSPIMFWGLMLSVGYFKDQWQADKP